MDEISHFMLIVEHERTSKELIMYAPYLYIYTRNTSKALEPFEQKGGRSHVAIWKWVHRLNPKRVDNGVLKHVFC
jgi:hypothetical protein